MVGLAVAAAAVGVALLAVVIAVVLLDPEAGPHNAFQTEVQTFEFLCASSDPWEPEWTYFV